VNLLLVTFSLRNPQQNYEPFFVALRGNALQWWHFIEQTCVVYTSHTPDEYVQKLLPYIEKTDSLLVLKVTPHEFQGWLPKEAWDWLNKTSEALQPKYPSLLSYIAASKLKE
jgi:hypothetical protein